MEKRPNISEQAFWYVHFDQIDYEKSKKWVIERVCLDGKDSDFFELLRFYGKEMIESVIRGRMQEIFNIKIANLFVMHEVYMLNLRQRQIDKGEVILFCKKCGNTDENKLVLCFSARAKIAIYDIKCRLCEYKSTFEI